MAIHYNINPTNSGLSDEQVRGAIEAAFSTWQAAAPRVRFVFDGFTSRVPTLGDRHNDIGFVHASSAHAVLQTEHNAMVEADMLLGGYPGSWTWDPCGHRDGSCTTTCVPTSSQTGCRRDVQAVVTHEAGHWLWLGDMGDSKLDRELTMNPSESLYSRFRSTLALGDVLGLRELYPCSCPLPPIYSP